MDGENKALSCANEESRLLSEFCVHQCMHQTRNHDFYVYNYLNVYYMYKVLRCCHISKVLCEILLARRPIVNSKIKQFM